MPTLRQVIFDTDTREGKVFDIFIQTLIILSVISFSLETLPGLSDEVLIWLTRFEIFCVAVFSIEYLLRVLLSKKSLKYIFSFYGIIDLIAILPYYLAMGVDLRSARIFRLFRLFRVFKMVRYNRAMQRFIDAFYSIRSELVIFGFMAGFLLYFTAVGIYFFENQAQPEAFSNIFDSLWWSIVTLTTVGYGDIYPITIGGRIFTMILLLIGLAVISIPTGLLASALTKNLASVDRD